MPFIAQRLGDRVRLNNRVRSISGSNSDHICVTTDRGVINAEHVIVATMPKDAGKIHFDPPLPEHHQALIATCDNSDFRGLILTFHHKLFLFSEISQ